MSKSYKETLRAIDTFIFDIDGVFTNSIVYLMPDGSQMRTANIRDGYAVQLAVKKGLNLAIISGGKNEIVRQRFEGLGVKDIYLGVGTKIEVFEKLLAEKGWKEENIAYMGDDIPDLEILKRVGLPTCPEDAAPEICAASTYVSHKRGGEGCVRDLLEQALRLKGFWPQV